ncbi:MAG: DUF4190 domain-containing protein [Phycisphaerae bacterium]|nr:DUF4190 domain-containing protein [Phycisphaerae bacterium]
MRCPQCGSANPDDSVRCFSCGCELAPAPAAAAAKTSGLAIAALVLGILAFFTCGITALPAIICGIVALVKIAKTNGVLKGMGMAITGIVLPFVFVAVVVPLLLAILMPALSRAKFEARRIVCRANLQTLSTAMTMYADWYEGNIPASDKWCDLLMQEADVSRRSFQCPTAPSGTCSYAINSNLQTLGGKPDPELVAIFESTPGWNQAGGPELLTTEYHDGGGCNVAFADGHTEFIPADELGRLKWTTDQ